MTDVTKLPMFTDPLLYDLVYHGYPRGKLKYTSEVDFIKKVATHYDLERKVLDVGCGTGTHLIELAKQGFQCHGVDLNPLMLEHARTKSEGLSIAYQQGDMRSFDLGRRFPIVTCLYGAFHYLPDEESAEQAVRTFFNHTEDNGVLIADIKTARLSPEITEEIRGGDVRIVTEWILDKTDPTNRTALYKAAIFKVGEDGFLTYEIHPVRFMDPFYIGDKLHDVGFKDVKVYADFDLQREVSRETAPYRTVIVARK